jgi:hypothetical protein
MWGFEVEFEARLRGCESADKAEKSLAAHFRTEIPSLPLRYKLPKTEFADNWLYLERAIRQACRSKPHPRFIHFEITERYFVQLRSISLQDKALAVQNRLILPRPRGARGGDIR